MTRPTVVSKRSRRKSFEALAAIRNLPVNTVKKWFETYLSRYGKLIQTKSGPAPVKSAE